MTLRVERLRLRPAALALVAAAVAALAAACNGASTRPTGPLVDDGGCQIGCDHCAPLAACVSTPYQPACVLPCAGPGGCDSGGLCVILDGADLGDDAPQPVCVSANTLRPCRSLSCHIEPRCRDAQTLLRPLAFKDQICAWELVRCDSGCDSTTAQCN
jgi:hypothetical protein